MSNKLEKIAVFTSGGDAPGMNAAIRGVVRCALYNKLKVEGIYQGYQGMIENKFVSLLSSSVSNIIQKGGTILKTARSDDFMTTEGRKKAFNNLKNRGVDALVAIGGDGTFKGAQVFYDEFKIPVIGIPGTIDNDLYGTDFTIGYDTAINTAIDAIDKIRDTADSHNRLFFVEVMGRDAGFIALRTGIGSGAEAILIPEIHTDTKMLLKKLELGKKKSKTSSIVIVSEGDETGGAFKIAEEVKKVFSEYDIRVSILGHIQRGGNPTCSDRVLAGRLGVAAVEALLKGETGLMVGVKHKSVTYTPFSKAIKHNNTIDKDLFELNEILSF
ncbi:MAG: 6-phosphofructokinase [Chitinophagaceae bacterium]|nr:MAG: 6-phosphofructokinase [Chitinophagaceae bacterium]